MTIDLKNKATIVTGAAGGIGKAICEKLAGFGINLMLVGRDENKLEAFARKLRTEGVHAECCAGDLRESEFIDTVLTRTRECFGRIDILINNAGLAHNMPMEEVPIDLFDDIWKTNVRAPYFLCSRALKDLRASDCATIINICTVVAHKGYPGQSAYAASKHGLLGMSKVLANEVYADNIRVHVISPGAVFTPMVAVARPDLTPDGMILPEDIANAVGFLLESRGSAAVIDELQVHRAAKAPFA